MSVETIFQVSPEEKLQIKQLYNKSDEELQSIVKSIQKWLETQPHLPNIQDDIFLECMLKLNKLNVDKTLNKLDMYYSIKHVVPEFFENRSPLSNELRSFMDTFMIVPLPQLTEDLYRVYMVKFINNDPEKFDLMTNAKCLLNLYDVRLHYDSAPGEIYIYDLAELRFGHVLKVNPMTLKKIYTVMEKAYSDRIKGIHFLNLPMVGNALISISKLILSEKLANRVYSHKDLNSLNEIIPLNLLPAEYNGSQRSLEELYGDWRKFIESKNSWILELGDKKSNEELRPNKEVASNMFGSMFGFFS